MIVFTSFIFCFVFFDGNIGQVCAKSSWNTVAWYSTRPTKPPTPKLISKTCLLYPDEGPCRGNIDMYYFDYNSETRNGSCKKFNWGGCQGNGNRFDTVAECYSTCLTKNISRENIRRPKFCDLTYDYGFCFGDIARWYYDRLWKVCKKTIYSGCGGNKNNFYTKEQCDSVCRFGSGFLTKATSSDKIRNRLIINPLNATPSRGKDQQSAKKSDKK